MINFFPLLNSIFRCLGVGNELETKENKISSQNKIGSQMNNPGALILHGQNRFVGSTEKAVATRSTVIQNIFG